MTLHIASTQPFPFFCRRLKLRRCGRRLRSLRRPQHGSLRPRRLVAALLPGRSNRGCDSRQRSRLRRGRSRRRTSCTRTPRPSRSSTASSSISSLGDSCQTRSSRTDRRRSASCKPSRRTTTRARCRLPAGSGTRRARCARSTSVARTLVGRPSPGCSLVEITTTARSNTLSRSNIGPIFKMNGGRRPTRGKGRKPNKPRRRKHPHFK